MSESKTPSDVILGYGLTWWEIHTDIPYYYQGLHTNSEIGYFRRSILQYCAEFPDFSFESIADNFSISIEKLMFELGIIVQVMREVKRQAYFKKQNARKNRLYWAYLQLRIYLYKTGWSSTANLPYWYRLAPESLDMKFEYGEHYTFISEKSS